jgi:hypothetical protein
MTTFAQRHPELVWSNPQADDVVFLRAALLRPRFFTVLDACSAFGLERVRAEWAALAEEGSREALRAAPAVNRMLHNIELGFADADATPNDRR